VWLALALALSHPDSLSHTRIHVAGARATVELRFQALSLIETVPGVERVRDGMLDLDEALAGHAAVEAYLLASLRLSRATGSGDETLPGRLVALTPEDPGAVGVLDLQQVEARLEFDSPAALEVLVVESRLFESTNPWHKDYCSLAWNDEPPVPRLFEGAERQWRFEPARVRRPGVLTLFLRLGVEHIVAGYDHQAFLLALFVASRRARSLVGVVTAFTLAHSLTLAAATLGWVDLPARFVELAIALSIAYVACDDLLRKETRTPWLEALAFGLLHGLGFAGFLGGTLAAEPLKVTALVGFNLGVELGQLALVLAALGVVALLARMRPASERGERRPGLVPHALRRGAAACVALLGFFWFLQRAGWLPFFHRL
jgi:hydrogenase/urease accessory protein HupE